MSDLEIPSQHNCDEKKDKTVSELLKEENMQKCFDINCEIKKVDQDKQLVYGWAYVSEKDGNTVVDHSGETASIDELQKAFHGFMRKSRQGGDSHNVIGVGEVVEGMVFTKELQEQLGVDLGKVGVFICMKVNDKEVWEKVKGGEYAMFSLGGSAKKREAD